MSDGGSIILMAVMLIMSAYFSATETAFSSLNKTRIKTMAEEGNKRAELAWRLSEKYDKLISTILIGNNIVNIAVSSVATVFFIKHFGDIGATLSTVVITVAVLIFGEISPKSIAKDCPEKFAMFSAPIIRILIFILTPVNFLFSLWKKLLSKLFKVEENKKMSQAELLMFVDEVEQEGSIDESSGDLLRNAIEFKERKAEDILTHRIDIEAVETDAEKGEIAKKFSDTKFSRLLVYEDSVDNIVGIIHQKDFYTDGSITKSSVKEIMTAPLFIHKTEKIDVLLNKLQNHKSHIAVVLDEFGGTLGIVTMEDILEELVGEIWDEHDEVVDMFENIGENLFRVDCAADVEEFCERFEVEIEESSISSWIVEQLGEIPELGDRFKFEHLSVTVAEIDSHRVTKIDVFYDAEVKSELQAEVK